MATTYSTLKTEIASFYDRNDLTSQVDTFIDFCEAEMQIELKLVDFEATSTVSVTSGEGTIPTGMKGIRSISWEMDPERILRYVTPEKLEMHRAGTPSMVTYYTITGTTIKTSDDSTGTLNITYMAKFTPLSDSNTTNVILTEYPTAYLYGSLVHASVFCKDVDGASGYKALFSDVLEKIKLDNKARKYAGSNLVVVPG